MSRISKLDKTPINTNLFSVFVTDTSGWIDREDKKGEGMNSADDLVDVLGVANSRDGFSDLIDEFCLKGLLTLCFGHGLCRVPN